MLSRAPGGGSMRGLGRVRSTLHRSQAVVLCLIPAAKHRQTDKPRRFSWHLFFSGRPFRCLSDAPLDNRRAVPETLTPPLYVHFYYVNLTPQPTIQYCIVRPELGLWTLVLDVTVTTVIAGQVKPIRTTVE